MSDAGEVALPEPLQDRISQLRRELSLEIVIKELKSAGAQVRTQEHGSTFVIYATYNKTTSADYGSPQ